MAWNMKVEVCRYANSFHPSIHLQPIPAVVSQRRGNILDKLPVVPMKQTSLIQAFGFDSSSDFVSSVVKMLSDRPMWHPSLGDPCPSQHLPQVPVALLTIDARQLHKSYDDGCDPQSYVVFTRVGAAARTWINCFA